MIETVGQVAFLIELRVFKARNREVEKAEQCARQSGVGKVGWMDRNAREVMAGSL